MCDSHQGEFEPLVQIKANFDISVRIQGDSEPQFGRGFMPEPIPRSRPDGLKQYPPKAPFPLVLLEAEGLFGSIPSPSHISTMFVPR